MVRRTVARDEPIRVVSVTRRLTVAGDETRLLNTALGFRPERVEHTVVVVSPTDGEDERWTGPMLETYRRAGVDVVSLALQLRGLRGAPNFARLLVRLTRLLRARRAHVVDARLGVPTTFGLVAAKLARVPVVVSTAYYPGIWTPPFKYVIGQACMFGVDALISDARATLDDFARWRWSDRAELVLIPNGIAAATSDLSVREARRRLGLADDPSVTVVGQVSRIINRKGYETFLHAARLLVDGDPSLQFVGVGFVAEDRAYIESLEALRARLRLVDHVQLLSYPGPIGDVYRALDVFTHLSTEDSSPIALHERMSVGLPTVVTGLPGNLEIVEDGIDCLVVPADDAPAAAVAIRRLIDDPALGRRLGAAARARYERDHRPEVMADAHEALFRRLLAPRDVAGSAHA